jgi:4-amino-4-deoxy-L-arabinose transferase-like glycosyltransferase
MRRAAGLRRWELWALVAILLAAALVRGIALEDVPPGLRYDELLNYRMAQRVIAGDRPIYFTESWGEEPFFLYAQALVISMTKPCAWSLRLPAAVSGLLAVLTAWLVARRLFGPRVAMLTAAALALSFWSVFFSREGLRVIAITPLSCLMVYFLWRGLERPARQRWPTTADLIASGICLGGAFYIYVAARVFPLLPIGLALYLALLHRPALKRVWPGLLLAVVIGGLLAAPLLYEVYGPSAAEERMGQLTGGLTALRQGDSGPVLNLTVRAAGMFFWRGEQDWLYNVHGRPIFDPLAAICFVLGVGICVWRWRQARFALLLLWLGVGLAPAALVPPPASLSHAIAAQPPAYILMAVGLEAFWRAIRRRWRWSGLLLVAGVIVLHGALSCYAYFVTWARAPEVRELHQGGVTAVARELDARDPPGPVAVGGPYVNYWHPWNTVNLDLTLRRGDLSLRWFNPAGGWVWPAGAGPSTYYFPADPLGPQTFEPSLQALFFADAALLPSDGDDFTAFRLDHPAALEARVSGLPEPALAWPPELGHLELPALPLTFGDRFALLGIELEETGVVPGGELRLTTYWEVLAANPAPVVAFVHLTSDNRDLWGQHDWLDVWADGLQPGDRFAQVHVVEVKPEVPPGLYHLELGLYGPDTLQRFPIVAGADTADRVWVGEMHVAE